MDRFDESFHSCPIDGSDESNDWTNIYSLPYPYERTKTYSPILPYSCPIYSFDESFYSCPIDGSDESNDWTNIYSLP